VRIAREGVPAIGGLLFLSLGGWFVFPPLSAVFLAAACFLLWFYRDPERRPPENPALWVSPADGRVVEVEATEHSFTGPATRVGVFMSPLDVHVNRVPWDGEVTYLQYVPGKKWVAYGPKASAENERFFLGMETAVGPVLVVQIAGFLARRIVCRARRGQHLTRGERYGMIQFGSKVDLYLPSTVRCVVSVGQKVKAGETALGVVGDEKE
jgi:phosphatidylserine decarboxylase